MFRLFCLWCHTIVHSLAEQSNEMERHRQLEKMRAQEQLHKKSLQDQLGLFQRQEEMRRKTIEKEAALRRETEMKKVDAEVAGRIRQEQENHDLRLEQARVQVVTEKISDRENEYAHRIPSWFIPF